MFYGGEQVELLALREYLNNEISRLEEYETEIECMFEKYDYHIDEIERKKQVVEKNFDFAYEAFHRYPRKRKCRKM